MPISAYLRVLQGRSQARGRIRCRCGYDDHLLAVLGRNDRLGCEHDPKKWAGS